MIKSSLSILLLLILSACGSGNEIIEMDDPIDPYEIESRSSVKSQSDLEVSSVEVSSSSEPIVSDVVQHFLENQPETESHRLSYLKHNSLFDVVKDDKNVKGTTWRLLEKIAAEPVTFTGQRVSLSLTNDGSFSAIGPVGTLGRNEQGKKIFKITDDRLDRRKNA
ncbi:MAG: hypothetical protein HRT44_04345, partial [Bdellovibrionales bacterium]|nr:hypothetical protein [Bdellovibrionales bacterium]NQZ18474.1 hypothetical protein [Bdellovibrionales bacterium]